MQLAKIWDVVKIETLAYAAFNTITLILSYSLSPQQLAEAFGWINSLFPIIAAAYAGIITMKKLKGSVGESGIAGAIALGVGALLSILAVVALNARIPGREPGLMLFGAAFSAALGYAFGGLGGILARRIK